MTASKCEISRCGLCRFYIHEGRRGGICTQLDVSVGSRWKACSLATSPFQPSISRSAVKMAASEVEAGGADCTPCEIADYSIVDYSSAVLNRMPVPVAPAKAIAPPQAIPPTVALASKRAQSKVTEDSL